MPAAGCDVVRGEVKPAIQAKTKLSGHFESKPTVCECFWVNLGEYLAGKAFYLTSFFNLLVRLRNLLVRRFNDLVSSFNLLVRRFYHLVRFFDYLVRLRNLLVRSFDYLVRRFNHLVRRFNYLVRLRHLLIRFFNHPSRSTGVRIEWGDGSELPLWPVRGIPTPSTRARGNRL